jgi:hypothetical protein
VKNDIRDNSIKVAIDTVVAWDKNPRDVNDADIARLKLQLQRLKQYKPMLCYKKNNKYVALGGNMRLRALKELGIKNVWINVVKPKNEQEKIELSLSDNDRVGYYIENELAELLMPFDKISLDEFKVDVGVPSLDLTKIVEDFKLDKHMEIDTAYWTYDNYIDAVVTCLLKRPYPYKTKHDIELIGDFYELCRCSNKHSIAGNSIAYELIPSMWEIKTGVSQSHHTPIDNWAKRTISRALKMHSEHTTKSLYNIRSLVSLMLGGHRVYQFRPALAKYYYATYSKDGDVIVDPSLGWGGRMLGWLSLGRKGKFYATDPSPDSVKGCNDILKMLHVDNSNIELIQLPYEDWNCKKLYGKVSMIITSPPYFDTEEYRGENQSYKRYPMLDKWLSDFLYVYIKQCATLLKRGGYFILNIDRLGKKKVDSDATIKQFIKKIKKLKLIEIANEPVSSGFGPMRGRGEPFYICQKD